MSTPTVAPLPARIKTRQLVLLTHIDRTGSVLAAADAAGMSQPAASKLLRELEQTLGAALFERHARGVVPTACGEAVIRHAHSALAEIRRAQEEVEALKRGGSLRVAIGSVLGPAADLLPAALARLADQNPRMTVSIEMDTSRAMVASLLAGRLDIVIGRIQDPSHAGDLAFEALSDEPHALFVRAGHPLARRRRLGIAQLVDQPWVMPPAGSMLRDRLEALFLGSGLAMPARVMETTSVPLIESLLRHTDAIVALPANLLQPACEAGMVRRLPVEATVRMAIFGLITRRHHTMSAHAAQVLAVLREAAAELGMAMPVPAG